MGGKTWSREEETCFWTKVIPFSEKRLQPELYPLKSWTLLAKEMSETMGARARRDYTWLSLYEHFYNNTSNKDGFRFSSNCGDYALDYINEKQRLEAAGRDFGGSSSYGRQSRSRSPQAKRRRQYRHAYAGPELTDEGDGDQAIDRAPSHLPRAMSGDFPGGPPPSNITIPSASSLISLTPSLPPTFPPIPSFPSGTESTSAAVAVMESASTLHPHPRESATAITDAASVLAREREAPRLPSAPTGPELALGPGSFLTPIPTTLGMTYGLHETSVHQLVFSRESYDPCRDLHGHSGSCFGGSERAAAAVATADADGSNLRASSHYPHAGPNFHSHPPAHGHPTGPSDSHIRGSSDGQERPQVQGAPYMYGGGGPAFHDRRYDHSGPYMQGSSPYTQAHHSQVHGNSHVPSGPYMQQGSNNHPHGSSSYYQANSSHMQGNNNNNNNNPHSQAGQDIRGSSPFTRRDLEEPGNLFARAGYRPEAVMSSFYRPTASVAAPDLGLAAAQSAAAAAAPSAAGPLMSAAPLIVTLPYRQARAQETPRADMAGSHHHNNNTYASGGMMVLADAAATAAAATAAAPPVLRTAAPFGRDSGDGQRGSDGGDWARNENNGFAGDSDRLRKAGELGAYGEAGADGDSDDGSDDMFVSTTSVSRLPWKE